MSHFCVYIYIYHCRDDETTGQVGRPREEIDLDDVEFLRSLKLTWTKIAQVLNVSGHTIYRRLKDEGRYFEIYTNISDQEVDRIVSDIKLEHPNDGEVLMAGHLQRHGIVIPRAKLRASIHRVDSDGVSARRAQAIRRRIYHVDFPNSVWHIDGNHKLIRSYMVLLMVILARSYISHALLTTLLIQLLAIFLKLLYSLAYQTK